MCLIICINLAKYVMIEVNRLLLKSMRYILSSTDLTNKDIENILSLASKFKRGYKENLKGFVSLLFLEPSTRTRLSFEMALKKLGLNVSNMTSKLSSMEKGETFIDTLITLESIGFDLVVTRTPFALFPYKEIKENVHIPIINAGDGSNQHPTQALIDLYTLREALGDLKGKKVVYIGDISHSRVFRSGVDLLNRFGVKVGVCGPETLIPADLDKLGVEEIFKKVDDAIEWADVCIWLRLQRERQKEQFITSEYEYFLQFGLTKERYEKVKLFMHPGPVNRNVDIDGDILYNEKSLILDQVKNGVFIRMALITYVLQSRTS